MAKIYTSDNFIVSGGTSSQFLKGDGTLDSSTYLTSLSGAVLITGNQSIGGYKNFTSGTTSFDGIVAAQLEFTSSGTSIGNISVGDYYFQFTAKGFYGYLFKNSSLSNILTLDNSGYATFVNTIEATAFKLTGGTSSQFLKGNGTVDTNTYITSASLSSYLLITTAASTYYPIPTGTTAQYIRGNGTLATFPTIPTVTPSAMTKVDDTNVTLTLGGTPSTSLLQATSLTLGWTGTLADSRITSAATWNSKQAGSTNLTSLSSLAYVSASFVKMTAAGTFSLDTNTYYLASNPSGFTSNTGTVTSVAAITLGTTGTDLSSTVATGTTTPVITLNVPTASASNRGALSAADWIIFNAKQAALINPITGTGTINELAYFTATGSTLGSLTTATYPSLTELSYVKGVTSSIQTQLGTKAPSSGSLNYIQASPVSAQSASIWTSSSITTETKFIAQTGFSTAPSYTFTGSLTSGFYTAAANQIDVAISNVNLATFSANKFNLTGSGTTLSLISTNSGASPILYMGTAATGGLIADFRCSSSNVGWKWTIGTVSSITSTPMTLTLNSNLLIGTTTEYGTTAKLQVTGDSLVLGTQYGKQNTPFSASSGTTVTGANLINGIIINTGSGWNLPTGANIDLSFFPTLSATANPTLASFDWNIVNTNTASATLAVATGHTFVGNLTIALSSSAAYRTVKTGIATYVTYRIS